VALAVDDGAHVDGVFVLDFFVTVDLLDGLEVHFIRLEHDAVDLHSGRLFFSLLRGLGTEVHRGGYVLDVRGLAVSTDALLHLLPTTAHHFCVVQTSGHHFVVGARRSIFVMVLRP